MLTVYQEYLLREKTVLIDKLSLPNSDQVLPGRDQAMPLHNEHYVNGRPLKAPFSDNDAALASLYLGMGCFWGAERKMWNTEGVFTTAVGYGAGVTPNPTYEEVCTGRTAHNEIVLVVYDPALISESELFKVFFESHDPTQGMRQGNDKGTQYRSGIYYTTESQEQAAKAAKDTYQQSLNDAGMGSITTEIIPAPEFYYAEQYHQQYLAKNPNGYCGIGGTGVTCAI